jgi:Proteolysis_6 C-terminal
MDKAPQHNSDDAEFEFLKECFCPICDSFSNYFMPLNKLSEKEGETEEISTINQHNIISIIGALCENTSSDKTLENSSDSDSSKNVGLDSIINSFQYFIETMSNDCKYDNFVREMEIYITFLKGVRINFGEAGNYEVMSFKSQKKKMNAEKRLYCNAIQKIIISSQTDKSFLEKAKRLLNDYVRDKAVERITLSTTEKVFNKTSMLYKIYDTALEFSLKSPQLAEELLYILKKIAYIYAIGLGQVQDIKNEKMQAILMTLHDDSKCNVKNLLALFEIKKKPEEYFKEILFDSDLNEDNLEFQLDCNPLNEKPLLFNIYAVNPSIIELPKSYLDFVHKYFRSLCSRCKGLPSHGDTALCLLCGEVFCVKKCTQKEVSEDSITLTLEGNLFKHRKVAHAGNGLYCEISSLNIILIYSSRTFVCKSKPLYTDSINQNIVNALSNPADRPLHNVDFRRFYLNKESVAYLQQMITKHRLPLEQLELNRTNNGSFFTKDI